MPEQLGRDRGADYGLTGRLAKVKGQRADWHLYWEPEDWSLGLDAEASYQVGQVMVQYAEEPIELPELGAHHYPALVSKIENRPLQPNPADPTDGSDVQMLETVLWQLGLSPQYGLPDGRGAGQSYVQKNAGAFGARIASNRNDTVGGPVTTRTCNNQPADHRFVFYTGNGTGCDSGDVSLEYMLARFQSRNNNDNHFVSDDEIFAQTAETDADTLNWLGRDWNLYLNAYNAHPAPVITQSNRREFADWILSGTATWENGIPGAHVGPTYTDNRHNQLMNRLGLSATDYTREGLLAAWIGQESPHHWGTNRTKVNRATGARVPYQRTDYRMTMGGDQHGSLSFSQLTYPLRFSINAACAAHRAADLNLYDPADQVKTFVVHGAANTTTNNNCEGGMYLAFVADTLGVAYETAPTAGRNISDLRGIQGITTPLPADEDDYEKLAKAIIHYNSPRPWILDHSLPYALKYFNHNGANGTNDQGSDHCYSCKYSIEARRVWLGDGNLRTYIWYGGTYPPTDPRAGQDWCFAYGEREWVAGTLFDDARNAADFYDAAGRPQIPIGQTPCS